MNAFIAEIGNCHVARWRNASLWLFLSGWARACARMAHVRRHATYTDGIMDLPRTYMPDSWSELSSV